MMPTPKRTVFAALLAAPLIILSVTQQGFSAQQRSLDLEISKVYSEIDQRSRGYEAEAAQIRARLEDLATQITEEEEKYRALSEELDADKLSLENQKYHARSAALAAKYANLAKQLLDSAAKTISENASGLHVLAEKIRGSSVSQNAVTEIKLRIQDNVAAGKAMRRAAQELLALSRKDPRVSQHALSLQKIMGPLDRRITLDKARLQAQLQDRSGEARNRNLESIDQALNTLSDMYASIAIERAALDDMKEEIRLAVYIGMVRAAETVAQKAIPGLATPELPDTTTIPGLMVVHDRVLELNRFVISNDNKAPSTNADGSIIEFKNF